MNAVEFFFAFTAVFSATAVIYAWYSWIYSLDDGYQSTKLEKQKLTRMQAKSK